MRSSTLDSTGPSLYCMVATFATGPARRRVGLSPVTTKLAWLPTARRSWSSSSTCPPTAVLPRHGLPGMPRNQLHGFCSLAPQDADRVAVIDIGTISQVRDIPLPGRLLQKLCPYLRASQVPPPQSGGLRLSLLPPDSRKHDLLAP